MEKARDENPVYASILLDAIQAEYAAAGPKPHAFDTPFRHSDGGACALQLAMKYQKVPESDPFDWPSMWVTLWARWSMRRGRRRVVAF